MTGPPPTDRYARQTAADRPGVAQPVPVRPVPEQPWGRIFLGAIVVFALLLGGWEAYWRSYGVRPSITNTYGLWAMQRRRIDAGEGNGTVLLVLIVRFAMTPPYPMEVEPEEPEPPPP